MGQQNLLVHVTVYMTGTTLSHVGTRVLTAEGIDTNTYTKCMGIYLKHILELIITFYKLNPDFKQYCTQSVIIIVDIVHFPNITIFLSGV